MAQLRRLTAPFDFSDVRRELEVPETFGPEALAEAERAAAAPLPDFLDATGLPMVTIDPPGSQDLDQAVHLAAAAGGYRVSYAIADVASFVVPGGALDAAVWPRGVTVYCPDVRIPLHPTVLSEGAASLLPGQVRPAVLWEIDLDRAGEVTGVTLGRALVRSVAQLTYPGVQADVDAGKPHPSIALLPEIGAARQAVARARHAIELDLPDQEVVADGDRYRLEFRRVLPVEAWNAEISLLTGLSAAGLMLRAGTGVLRTLPPAPAQDVERLRRLAPSLGVDWPAGEPVGDVLAGLDPDDPRHRAFTEEATTLLRGAGYTPFGDGALPEQPEHAAIGAPYAHVTAPLRRLVDRYATEICLAAQAGTAVPPWVLEQLDELPEAMTTADRRAGQVERACIDKVEAHLLAGRVGETFEAVVVDAESERGTVVLTEPAVRALCDGAGLELGATVAVRLTEADVQARRVRFARA